MAKHRNRTIPKSFSQRLVTLISESEFIRFEHILGEPNFFRIVGRTHYERWHSCFLGWLLDPGGSHLLSNYTLIRFLLLLTDERCLKPITAQSQNLLDILPTLEFNDVEVTPNEYVSTETSIQGVGRFDIFLTATYQNTLGSNGKINIIFELKIDSKPNGEQSRKYADWLLSNHPNDSNFLVYLLPKLGQSSEETVDDNRWHCINYQLLNDKLLLPLLDHPSLNDKVKPFVVQYLKNLKSRYRGIKMAITNEEKKMAIALYEKYSDVFDSIYDALFAEGIIDYSTSDIQEPKGRVAGRIAAKVDGKVFSSENLRLLFSDVLKYLVDKDLIKKLPLPWGSTKQ
ncbi:MAG: PD-(D/E)XK nuclease family protein [Acidobacteria bacterium]|nr:PD-(D/E)XK nuclease family protein [Acidobacteriota bacterium]MBI3422727.1 PD-(D/E)XK nuclease family protein [Acidobacteriota bacterium]